MARSPQRLGRLSWMVGLLLGAVAVGGGIYLSQQVSDPFRTIEPLKVEDYLTNANGLRGNVYKVRGQVDNQLRWRADGTRVIAVSVEEDLLPLLLPASLRGMMVQKGQIFFFEVEVGAGGILTVRSMVKA